MPTLTETLTIVGFVLTTLGFIPLYSEMLRQRRKDKLSFEVETFEERLSTPMETVYTIRIKNPNRTMEHVKVFVADAPCIVLDSVVPLEAKIPIDGGENFRIPSNRINPFGSGEGQMVTIKEGGKTRKKITFRKIMPVKP